MTDLEKQNRNMCVRSEPDEPLNSELVFSPDTRMLVIVVCANPGNQPRSEERLLIRRLHEAGVGTLRVDLLTQREAEAVAAGSDLDVPALAERITRVARRLRELDWSPQLRVGYYGGSWAACSALRAASEDRAFCDALIIYERRSRAANADPQPSPLATDTEQDTNVASLVDARPDPELVKDLFRNWLPESPRVGSDPTLSSRARSRERKRKQTSGSRLNLQATETRP